MQGLVASWQVGFVISGKQPLMASDLCQAILKPTVFLLCHPTFREKCRSLLIYGYFDYLVLQSI